MEHLVIDSCVIISYLVESDTRHQDAVPYIDGLENGDYTFHTPMLAAVEVVAAISRRNPLPNELAILVRWHRTLSDWEQSGKITLYPLDRNRMIAATNIAQQYRLRGGDSVFASLADELDIPLRTFDQDILLKFQRASV